MQDWNDTNRIQRDRDMLVRFCSHYTGDAHIAEDLAQQTLLSAWQHEHQLRNNTARQAWLIGIARNQARMWGRKREALRVAEPESRSASSAMATLPDDFDLEEDLERAELATLLDRALALLPPATRDVLIHRYIEDLPQAEIAARVGASEGAVEARLHRGKLALKRVLMSDLSEQSLSFNLFPLSEAGWEQTRIWCPGCGQHRLEGYFNPESGVLILRCRQCAPPDTQYIGAHFGDRLRDLHSYRPAVSRVLDTIDQLFQKQASAGWVDCSRCGAPLAIGRNVVPQLVAGHDILSMYCARCQWLDCESWHSLTWSLPEGRRFWQENPRMRYRPEREIEIDGRPAMLTGFETMDGTRRLEATFLRDTCEVVRIVAT